MVFQAPVPNPDRKENVWANLVCNLVLPCAFLSESVGGRLLGPRAALLVALSIPTAYGIWDFYVRRVFNFWSILMFGSILVSGGLGLMKLDGFWFAVKEAAVSWVIGLMVLLSVRTKTPVVRSLLYNDQLLRLETVHRALFIRGRLSDLDQLLVRVNRLLAWSFLLSGCLNFALAQYLLKSPAGTTQFNSELAKLNAWAWPVIVVPSGVMVVYSCRQLVQGLSQLSGLHPADMLRRGRGELETSKGVQ